MPVKKPSVRIAELSSAQEPVLFSALIEKNILFGVPESNPLAEERMLEVSKLSNCHDLSLRRVLESE